MRDAGNVEPKRGLVYPIRVPCTMYTYELLAQVRRLAEEARNGDLGNVRDLLATFAELDERLSNGGRLPDAWKEAGG